MRKDPSNKKLVSFKLTAPVRQALAELARLHQVSMTSIIETLVRSAYYAATGKIAEEAQNG